MGGFFTRVQQLLLIKAVEQRKLLKRHPVLKVVVVFFKGVVIAKHVVGKAAQGCNVQVGLRIHSFRVFAQVSVRVAVNQSSHLEWLNFQNCIIDLNGIIHID